ncbi:hypothetical protein [Neisseria sp.]|uniref:hypothetical protein n=1 Tax=Neisseria sp. TaxID=192066 RepID=UPI0026DB8BE9|nr:hypothetical protein [Neisseria sp.]MDO4906989.1 hypothetical protein [Neisseria sp.]
MSAFALTNTVLIAFCVFLALLARSRSKARNKAYFEQICRHTATKPWLEANLSGAESADNIRKTAKHFNISRTQAKQLIGRYRQNLL